MIPTNYLPLKRHSNGRVDSVFYLSWKYGKVCACICMHVHMCVVWAYVCCYRSKLNKVCNAGQMLYCLPLAQNERSFWGKKQTLGGFLLKGPSLFLNWCIPRWSIPKLMHSQDYVALWEKSEAFTCFGNLQLFHLTPDSEVVSLSALIFLVQICKCFAKSRKHFLLHTYFFPLKLGGWGGRHT